jgi:hypothetical protein
VSWKFWKKEEDNDFNREVLNEQIPLSTLIRWYCYDLGVEDANDLFKAFDLMPVSQEGEEYELDQSTDRVKEVDPLLPFFEMIAAINAKAITTIQLDESGGEILQDSDRALMEGLYRQVSFAALVAAFSSALEIGFINKSYNLISIYGADTEEDNDEQ